MTRVIILAKHPGWGAADNFYRAFSSQGFSTVLLCLKNDKAGRTAGEKIVTILHSENYNQWFKKIMDKKTFLFLCSPIVIASIYEKIGQKTEELYKKKRKAIFITGTDYLRKSGHWNRKLNSYNFETRFAEPEMIYLNPTRNISLLHPMEYKLDTTKNKEITVSHAPGLIERDGKKGTSVIERGIKLAKNEVKFNYDHIVGVPFRECLKRKAQSHIFIDQINSNVGGIGKNGLEAISLNCITMCSLNKFSPGERYADHPIINIQSSEDVATNIIRLVNDRRLLEKEIQKVSEWKEIINYKSTVNFISKYM